MVRLTHTADRFYGTIHSQHEGIYVIHRTDSDVGIKTVRDQLSRENERYLTLKTPVRLQLVEI